MDITVDAASAIPPFEQVRDQIAALILSGDLADGAKLPPIRQLAGDLRLAAGTVARAYAELEEAGLVASARSKGTRVIGQAPLDASVIAAADAYVAAARDKGLDLGAIIALVRSRAATA